MVDGLEVPAIFAGLHVERDQGIAVDVVARPAAAPVVGRRGADGNEDQAEVLVHGGHERPLVGARAAPPAVAPSVMVFLSGQGHGLEFPELPAGPHVEAARIARDAERILRRGGADLGDVAGDGRRTAVGDAHRGIAAVAEGLRHLPAGGVERKHARPDHDQDARRRLRIPRPIADASRRYALEGLVRVARLGMDPDLLAGVGVEGDDPVGGGEIHDPPDHQGRGGVVAAQRIGPRRRQLRHIGAIDLVERRKAGGGQVAIDRPPVAVRNGDLRFGPGDRRRGEQRRQPDPTPNAHEPRPPVSRPAGRIRHRNAFALRPRESFPLWQHR